MDNGSFRFRRFRKALYGGDGYENQESSERDRNICDSGRGIDSKRCPVDECSGREISDGQSQTDTSEVRQNYIRRLQESKERSGPLKQWLSSFHFHRGCFYEDVVPNLE